MSVTDRLYRRIMMATAGVTISATNDTGPVHLVQGKVRGTPETIDNLQVVQLYGFASHAPAGSDALAIFGNGDRSNGVIVATANQGARPRGQKPGEVSIFDDQGTIITLHRDGAIEIHAATKVRIVTPRLEVTGDIIDHCDDQAHTAANMREIYNTHTHGAVQSGAAHTARPDQLQAFGGPHMTEPGDTDERIRRRAYELWEDAGRPTGRDAEFWEAAAVEIGDEIARDRTPTE